MRKTLLAALAGAATVAFCAASAAAAAINVLRGADGEIVSGSHNGVNVVRGGRATAVRRTAAAAVARPAYYAVAGGDVLWLVDSRTNRLTACTVRGTSVAGKSGIYCTAGYLP
jgi:hypothetical protein